MIKWPWFLSSFLPLTLAVCVSYAEEVYPEPTEPTTPFVREKVTVESYYYYRIAEYNPPVKLWPVILSQEKSFESPEDTLRTFVNAMASGNYQLWLSCWAPSDRRKIETDNTTKDRDEDFWRVAWKRVFETFDAAVLTTRLNTNGYAILAYRLAAAPDSGEDDFAQSVVFKRGPENEWLVTNDLSGDPVFRGWDVPNRTLTEILRRD